MSAQDWLWGEGGDGNGMLPSEQDDGGEWWEQHGYLAGRPLDAGLWLVIAPMIFTFRVMVCDQVTAGMEFYCYPHLDDAMRCFDTWDGMGQNPVEGWTRAHRT